MVIIKKGIIMVCLAIIFLVIAKHYHLKNNILKIFYKKEYSQYVEKYATENNIDELLIYSIIKAESNFDSSAVSKSGATGLMQLMEKTAEEVAKKSEQEYIEGVTLFNPEDNIKLGTIYFKRLLDLYDNNELLALTAYNAGQGNVDKWIEQGVIKKDGTDIENIPYNETNMYVRKIKRNYEIYKKIYILSNNT